MALVVDSDDDKRSVGGVTENTLNDPTFIARPGSGLKLTCPELGNGSLEIPVKGYSHRVRINHIWAGDAFEGSAEPQTGNIILAEFENRWRCPEIYAQAHIRIDEEHANNDIDPETVYADNKFTESEYATLIEKVDELGLPESVMKIVWVPRRIQPLLINDETKQLTDALFGKNLQGNPGNHRKDIVVLFLYNLAQSDLSAKKIRPNHVP